MKSLGIITILVLAAGIFASPLASAQTYQQTISTDAGTLKVGIATEPASPKPGEQSKLKIDFLNPQTNGIQEHIDYTVLITNNGQSVFGPIPLTHTSLGTATIPIQFKDGENKIVIDVQGILFRPIPSEKASFSIVIGEKPAQPKVAEKPTEQKQSDKPRPELPPYEFKGNKTIIGTSLDANKNSKSNEDKKLEKSQYKKADKTDVKKDSKKDKKKDTKKKAAKTTKKPVKKDSK